MERILHVMTCKTCTIMAASVFLQLQFLSLIEKCFQLAFYILQCHYDISLEAWKCLFLVLVSYKFASLVCVCVLIPFIAIQLFCNICSLQMSSSAASYTQVCTHQLIAVWRVIVLMWAWNRILQQQCLHGCAVYSCLGNQQLGWLWNMSCTGC